MPLRRSAVGRASRKDEVSSLLGWNGEAEDAAPCSTLLTVAPHLDPLCYRVRSLKAISVMTGRRDT